MELYKEILDFVLPLLATISLAVLGYIVRQIDKVKSSVSSLNEWRAKTETVVKYERKDINDVSSKLEGLISKTESVGLTVYEMKATMTKTWDKVLDLERDLKKLEDKVIELTREVFKSSH